MSLVVDNMAGKCPKNCLCEDFDDALDDSLESCQNACLADSTCLSVEYEDNNDHDCKLCTEICSTDLRSGSHHWCYIRIDDITTPVITTGRISSCGNNKMS